MLLFLLPRTQGYHFFRPSEVGTLQFANHLWTALCVVSIESGHFPVASNASVLFRSSGLVMWICKSLFLAMPAHSAALLGLPPRGLWEDSGHQSPVTLRAFPQLLSSQPCVLARIGLTSPFFLQTFCRFDQEVQLCLLVIFLELER